MCYTNYMQRVNDFVLACRISYVVYGVYYVIKIYGMIEIRPLRK